MIFFNNTNKIASIHLNTYTSLGDLLGEIVKLNQIVNSFQIFFMF
jgi:hypothetical protein